jgi:hypothetical protein
VPIRAGSDSKAGFVKLWARTVLDLATTALAERVSSCANDKEVIVNNHKLAAVSFALLLLPLFFVSSSLLKYGLGIGLLFDPLETFLSVSQGRDVFNTVSPVVFLGGSGLALAMNLYAVLWPSISKESATGVSIVRLKLHLLNIAVILASSLLLAALLVYAFLENVAYRY